MPAGCQFKIGLAERRVQSIKKTLNHMLATTLVGGKLTLHCAELQTILARAANIINNWPIGVRSLTEEDIVPITVNQLLLGRTLTSTPGALVGVSEDFLAANSFQEELMRVWWNLWKEQVFPHLCRAAREPEGR